MSIYMMRLAALADPTRFAVFERALDGPDSVGELASELGISSPAVSHHLKVLKDAGLLRPLRRGPRFRYRANNEALVELNMFIGSLRDRTSAATGGRPSKTTRRNSGRQSPRQVADHGTYSDCSDSIDERLAGWARECPGLDIRAVAFTSRISRLNVFLELDAARKTRNSGIVLGDLEILGDLLYRGPPYEAMPTELHDRFRVTLPGLLKRLNRLTKLGFVQRVRPRRGTHGALIRLTKAGLLFQREFAVSMRTGTAVLDFIRRSEEEEVTQVVNFLRRLLAHIEKTA